MVKNLEKSLRFSGFLPRFWVTYSSKIDIFRARKWSRFAKRRRRTKRRILQASKFFKHHAIAFCLYVWEERVDLTTDDLSNWLEGIVFLQRRHDNWFDPNILAKKSLENTRSYNFFWSYHNFSKVTCLVRKWCFRDVRLLSRCFFNSYLRVSAIILFEVRNSSGTQTRKHELWLWRWKSTSRCSLIEVLLLEKRVSNHFSGQAYLGIAWGYQAKASICPLVKSEKVP